MLTDNSYRFLYAVFCHMPANALISIRNRSMKPIRKTDHSTCKNSGDANTCEWTDASSTHEKIFRFRNDVK